MPTLLALLALSLPALADDDDADETEAPPAEAPESAEPAPEPESVRIPAFEPAPAEERLDAPTAELAASEPDPEPLARATTLDRWGKRNGQVALRAWGAAYGTFVGASTGYLIGEATEPSELAHTYQGPVAGGLVGIGVGYGTAALVGSKIRVSNDDVVLLTSATAIGAYAGGEVGRMAIPLGADGDIERIQAARLGGSMLGAGLAFATQDAPSASRTLRVDLATLVGWQTGTGINDMAGWYVDTDRRPRAAVALGTTAAFTGVAIGAEALGLERLDGPSTALGLGHGAWIGLMAPLLVTDTPQPYQRFGAARAGLGVGYLAAVGASAAGGVRPKSAGLQAAGIAIGNAIGAGIPLSLGGAKHARGVIAPALVGGIAGQALGAGVAPYYELGPNDAYLLATLGAWGAYQTAGWTVYAAQTHGDATRPLGFALTAAGGSSLLALTLAPVLDIDAPGSIALLSAGGWGTWFGGWAGTAAHLDPDHQWLVMLSAGNASLVGVAVAEAAGWKPDWRTVGIVDGFGVMGAAVGGMFGVIFLYDEDNWDPMVWSTIGGSVVGLTTGAVLAATPRREGRHTRQAMLALPDPVLRGRVRGLVPGISAQPWTDDEGAPGAYVELRIDEVAL